MDGSLVGGCFWYDSFVRPTPLALMVTEQLLATYSKNVETSSPNADNLGHVLDYLSQIPISGIMLVGTAGIAGTFMGQSTSTSTIPSSQLGELTASSTWSSIGSSKSLLMPRNLLPSSWQFEPKLVSLQGGLPEETLLVILAERYLYVKPTNDPSEVSLALILPFN